MISLGEKVIIYTTLVATNTVLVVLLGFLAVIPVGLSFLTVGSLEEI